MVAKINFIFVFINFNGTLVSSTHTLPGNIFNLEGGETMLARDKGNFHAPSENRTRDPASFFQLVDDWTLVKITEKIIQRNVFLTKEKETKVKC